MPGTVAEEVERADAVFVGKVVAMDIPTGLIISSADPVRVTFSVSSVWKGSDDKTLIVITKRDSASCGYPFEEDKEYLVYAYIDEQADLHANLCSRTALLSDAQEDLALLENGFVPEETVSSEENSLSIFVAILILSLISFVLFMIYTKNKK